SYPGSAGPPDLAGFIGCPFRSPPDRIGDPTVDVGFPPSRAVGADLELGRKRALGDLAVDGGPGQAGAVADGVKADDTVWLAHGNDASCWLFLTGDDRAMIYGALLWVADKLKSEQSEHARALWAEKGKEAFDND